MLNAHHFAKERKVGNIVDNTKRNDIRQFWSDCPRPLYDDDDDDGHKNTMSRPDDPYADGGRRYIAP